jgi:hypothetical protein
MRVAVLGASVISFNLQVNCYLLASLAMYITYNYIKQLQLCTQIFLGKDRHAFGSKSTFARPFCHSNCEESTQSANNPPRELESKSLLILLIKKRP